MLLIIKIRYLLEFLGVPCFVNKVLHKRMCKHRGALLEFWTSLILKFVSVWSGASHSIRTSNFNSGSHELPSFPNQVFIQEFIQERIKTYN